VHAEKAGRARLLFGIVRAAPGVLAGCRLRVKAEGQKQAVLFAGLVGGGYLLTRLLVR
jgi:hypothetical protein